jgi:hypothetical protein
MENLARKIGPPVAPVDFHFPNTPGRAFTAQDARFEEDFRRFANETHRPEAFPGLDTTKVRGQPDFTPVWKFKANPARRPDGLWIPCPVCRAHDQKFLAGALAYFPLEGVYRFIGLVCTAKHFGTAKHRQGWLRYETEQQRKRDEDFLLGVVGHIPALLYVLQKLEAPAVEAERLRHLLCKGAHLGSILAPVIKSGNWRLVCTEYRRTEIPDPSRADGMRTQMVPIEHNFGTLRGGLLITDRFKIVTRLRVAINRLAEDDHGSGEQAQFWLCDHANDAIRLRQMARLIGDSVKVARIARSAITQVTDFFDRYNFEALNAWGSSPHNTVELRAAARDDGTFVITLWPGARKCLIRPNLRLLTQLPDLPLSVSL